MPNRTLGFLLLSLVLAAAAGYSNWRYLDAANNGEGTVATPVALRDVVIARTDLSVSEEINSLMLGVVEWPEDLVPTGSFQKVAEVAKRIPRRHFAPGEPILEAGLFAEGALGGLSPLIQSGLRAMSVKVDEIIGIAGFVTVGSSVDVLATLRRTIDSEAFSQVILEDVRVLAVDRTLEPRKADSDERVSVVTLEVTPVQAKKLAFASAQGSIQLALRNPADVGAAAGASVGAPNLKGRVIEKDGNTGHVVVLRGLTRSVESYSQDVGAPETATGGAPGSGLDPPRSFAKASLAPQGKD